MPFGLGSLVLTIMDGFIFPSPCIQMVDGTSIGVEDKEVSMVHPNSDFLIDEGVAVCMGFEADTLMGFGCIYPIVVSVGMSSDTVFHEFTSPPLFVQLSTRFSPDFSTIYSKRGRRSRSSTTSDIVVRRSARLRGSRHSIVGELLDSSATHYEFRHRYGFSFKYHLYSIWFG